MDSTERTTILAGLGRQIARILTTTYTNSLAPSWEFVEPTEATYSVYMQNRGTGARIYLQLISSKGYELCDRVQVSGWLHIGKNRQYVQVYGKGGEKLSYDTITIARTKGCDAIAKDISKRFLPHYLEVFALARAKVDAEAAYEISLTNTLKRLAHVAGTTVPKPYSSDVVKSTTCQIGEVYVSIEARDDSTANLELSYLTAPQAEYILNYLKLQAK